MPGSFLPANVGADSSWDTHHKMVIAQAVYTEAEELIARAFHTEKFQHLDISVSMLGCRQLQQLQRQKRRAGPATTSARDQSLKGSWIMSWMAIRSTSGAR